MARVRTFVADNLWSREPLEPAPLGWLRGLVQLGILIGQGFVRDQLLMRATSLTYWTMLSIVPFLALFVTFADLIGTRDEVASLIETQLAAAVPEAAEYLLSFVRDLDFGALGAVGGGLLIANTLLVITQAEHTLNAIWGVTKPRPWIRRIPDYMAVLVVTPLLLGVAIPLSAAVESQWIVQKFLSLPGFDAIYAFGLSHAPTALFVAAFAFLYWFLTNTEVRPLSALLGGIVAGLAFAALQQAYLGFQIGAARYNAIFGTFAAIPLFMGWLYLSWAVILFGAEVAYAHQTLPLYRREVRGAAAGPAARETIGLAIALDCARAFRDGSAPWTADRLSDRLDVPLRTVREVVQELEKAGIVTACGDTLPGAFQLGRAADHVRVADVLAALRGPRAASLGVPDLARAVTGVLQEIDECASQAADASTLRALLDSMNPAPAPEANA